MKCHSKYLGEVTTMNINILPFLKTINACLQGLRVFSTKSSRISRKRERISIFENGRWKFFHVEMLCRSLQTHFSSKFSFSRNFKLSFSSLINICDMRTKLLPRNFLTILALVTHWLFDCHAIQALPLSPGELCSICLHIAKLKKTKTSYIIPFYAFWLVKLL